MKVPEKILITQDEDTKELSEHWCLKNLTNNPHIEYINKDAFIDKACDWLEGNIDRYLYNTGGYGEYIPKCGGKMYEDFKKAMEE